MTKSTKQYDKTEKPHQGFLNIFENQIAKCEKAIEKDDKKSYFAGRNRARLAFILMRSTYIGLDENKRNENLSRAKNLLNESIEILENHPLQSSKYNFNALIGGLKEYVKIIEVELNRRPSSIFEKIIEIERKTRKYVEDKLKKKYGEEKEKWWVDGVPKNLRIEVAKRKEEDSLRQEYFRYLYFIDLKEIIEKNKDLFSQFFRGYSNYKEALKILIQLNEIRNVVVHDKRTITNEENCLVNELENKINELC